MIIKHNMSAMNAERQSNMVNGALAKSTEKLSSGYRVNRAADDAAGLSISEKMRRQIRGLSQASMNAQDGISMVQIADGALAEVHDMLHRGTELSIKAATASLSDIDRVYIQDEIDQIMKEIDGIAQRTTFNETQVLLADGYVLGDSNVTITSSMPSWVDMGASEGAGYMAETYTTQEDYTITHGDGTITSDKESIKHEAAILDFSAFNGSASQIKDLVGSGFYSTCCTCSSHYSIKFVDEAANSKEQSGIHNIFNVGIKGVTNVDDLLNRIIAATDNGYPNSHFTKLAAGNDGKLYVYDDRSNTSSPIALGPGDSILWDSEWSNPYFNVTASVNRGKFGKGIATDPNFVKEVFQKYDTFVQVGAESGQHIPIILPSISCQALGIDSVSAESQDKADLAITAFKEAVQYVSTERSRMGAYQNRLEHTIANLDNVVENTTAAETNIRDTNMAKEMVAFSNQSILSQVGQAMLSQANQQSQGVLGLL